MAQATPGAPGAASALAAFNMAGSLGFACGPLISSLLLAFYAGFTAHPHVPVFVSIGAVEVGLALYVYHIARSGRLRTPAVLDSQ